MSKKTAEFFEPHKKLMQKTGMGGLSSQVIDNAQRKVDSMDLQTLPLAVEKIQILKTQFLDESFINGQNDNQIEQFLHELVPLDINIKLAKKDGLAQISSNLLKFSEQLSYINVDALNVIRAHVNALDIAIAKNITDKKDPILQKLTQELADARMRYKQRHG